MVHSILLLFYFVFRIPVFSVVIILRKFDRVRMVVNTAQIFLLFRFTKWKNCVHSTDFVVGVCIIIVNMIVGFIE